jgi:hypothetical protein
MPLPPATASWLMPVLSSGLALAPLHGAAVAPPPPPPPLEAARPMPARPDPAAPGGQRGEQLGEQLRLNGRSQRAGWLWVGPATNPEPAQLWLTLEVLQEQLGVSSRTRPDGALDLEWFGQPLLVSTSQQRSLGDEVAVDAWPLLQAVGVRVSRQSGQLALDLPPAGLLGVRSSNQGQTRRVVLDLQGPALVSSSESELLLDLQTRPDQLGELRALGLVGRAQDGTLALRPSAGRWSRVFSLGEPARLVIELPAGDGPSGEERPQPIDPRLQALLGRELQWDRLDLPGVRINAVRLDPRTAPLQLRPLARSEGMEGLSSLLQLAGRNQALVAINGGYFNRVRRLPLGALKVDGRWRSGPILNRGVVAWGERSLPQFGRLMLQESVSGPDGRPLPLNGVNSGYVQRGLSRYNADWGPAYRALSGQETGLLLRGTTVLQRLDTAALEQGVALRPGEQLLVARGGTTLPWEPGDSLQLLSRASSALGNAPNVLGGGPLLLLDGLNVLNGAAEQFSASFLRQGAPRTVIGSDGRQLWLITMEGQGGAGPTLSETAALLQRLGLRDALNLDGGSSTGLVMGGSLQVKGRGVAGSVHNALGLVP